MTSGVGVTTSTPPTPPMPDPWDAFLAAFTAFLPLQLDLMRRMETVRTYDTEGLGDAEMFVRVARGKRDAAGGALRDAMVGFVREIQGATFRGETFGT